MVDGDVKIDVDLQAATMMVMRCLLSDQCDGKDKGRGSWGNDGW